MRKMSKIIFMVVLMLMLVLSYTSIVKAATELDYSGYKEISEDTTTGNNDDKKVTTDTKAAETNDQTKNDIANKATEPHSQAGSFETKAIVSAGAVVLVLAGVGYVKYKKYNF